VPKYSIINPARARIHVVIDEVNDIFVPIRAAAYTKAKCRGRPVYIINGQEYSECSFCGASCPSRDFFKEPDSDLPVKCDLCEDEPPLPEPMCVQVCASGALTYEEREEEGEEEEEEWQEIEMGLQSLVSKHGMKKVKALLARMPKE
jgi:benzoyl-CoA reductase subunit BamC